MHMNVSLTPNLEQFVRDCTATGDYNNSSEVVREAIRLLKNVREQRAMKLAYLKSAIQTGDAAIAKNDFTELASNKDLDNFFARL